MAQITITNRDKCLNPVLVKVVREFSTLYNRVVDNAYLNQTTINYPSTFTLEYFNGTGWQLTTLGQINNPASLPVYANADAVLPNIGTKYRFIIDAGDCGIKTTNEVAVTI